MFADMLGFAALTESAGECLPDFPTADFLWQMMVTYRGGYLETPLQTAFANFHAGLSRARADAGLSVKFDSISFSDSLFVALANIENAVTMATTIMHEMMLRLIPVRIGIGYGTFKLIRVRSDVSIGVSDHSAQFLGTGIVRAHAAESCGIPGMRIFIHPSALPLFSMSLQRSDSQYQAIACEAAESDNRVGVTHEVNYLDWRETANRRMWNAFRRMWHQSPPSALHHYRATATAINKMRSAVRSPQFRIPRSTVLPREK